MRLHNYFFIFAGITLCAAFGCENERRIPGDSAPVLVQTVIAEKKPFTDNLISFGTLSFKSKNDVTALVEGTLYNLPAKEGDAVRKGQIIARMRNVQLEMQREQARNSVDSAAASLNLAKTKLWDTKLGIESRLLSVEKSNILIAQKEVESAKMEADLQNNKMLYEMGGVTESERETKEIAYKSALAELESMRKERTILSLGLTDQDLLANGITPAGNAAEKKEQIIAVNTKGILAEIEAAESNLRNANNSLSSVNTLLAELTLYAPVDGVVGARYYENGEFVKQNEKVFTIIDIADVYAVFYIQEQDIINFAITSPLELEVQSLGKTIPAKIDEISPMADAQSGNFSVKALIQNTDGDLRPGMFVRCVIPRSEQMVYIALPESALVNQMQEKGTVFCVVNGIAIQKEVGILAQRDGVIWIKSGLNEKEEVIDKPTPFLKEGIHVSIM